MMTLETMESDAAVVEPSSQPINAKARAFLLCIWSLFAYFAILLLAPRLLAGMGVAAPWLEPAKALLGLALLAAFLADRASRDGLPSFGRLGLGLQNPGKALCYAAAAFIGGWLVHLVFLWPYRNHSTISLMQLGPPQILTPALLIYIFAMALHEELIFRVYQINLCEPSWGARGAAVLSAVIFTVFHGLPLAHPAAFLAYFSVGLVLGWTYRASGTVWSVVLAHALHNCLAFAF